MGRLALQLQCLNTDWIMFNVKNQMFQAVKQVYNFALWENLNSYFPQKQQHVRSATWTKTIALAVDPPDLCFDSCSRFATKTRKIFWAFFSLTNTGSATFRQSNKMPNDMKWLWLNCSRSHCLIRLLLAPDKIWTKLYQIFGLAYNGAI